MKLPALFLLLVPALCPAQHEPPVPAKIVALPADTLIAGVGTCDLTVTTRDELTKKLVQQGFALAHCFWYNEGVRSFRDACRRDPDCPTAWLGLSYVLTMPWFRSNENKDEAEWAMKRAVAVADKGSAIEQELIAACRLRSFGDEERGSPFEKAILSVIKHFPRVAEPRLMLAGIRAMKCLSAGYDSKGNRAGTMREVVDLVEPILKWDPNCAGAHHYLIHAYEAVEPDKGIRSADALGLVAPGSSHMVHMPGHIYNRIGAFDRADQVFRKSTAIDEAYYAKVPESNTGTNWNYGHNISYTAINLADAGKVEQAKELEPKNAYLQLAIAWRAGDWADARRRSIIFGKVDQFFAGMAAVQQNDLSTAKASLWSLYKDLATKDPAKGDPLSYYLTKTSVEELHGSILARESKIPEAIKMLRQACSTYNMIAYEEPPYYPRLPHESLAALLIQSGDKIAANKVIDEGLAIKPHSFWLEKLRNAGR